MRVVSLSTIPPRFSTIGPTLKSLLAQKGRIDEIRLYIPRVYRRFPDYDGSLPAVPEGITIIRSEVDLGPASKVLFAAKDLRETRATILFCDDDLIFRPTWADELFSEQEKRPDECVALWGKFLPSGCGNPPLPGPAAELASKHRSPGFRLRHFSQRFLAKVTSRDLPRITRPAVARAGYAHLALGVGGVVVKPWFFDDEAFDIPPDLWSVDDIWLSGMLAKKGVPIWLPANLARPGATKADEIAPLKDAMIGGATRGETNRRCVTFLQANFGVWQN